MTNTRRALENIGGHLDESMGVREADMPLRLSPVPSPRDQGRRPLRNVGQVDINRVIPDPHQPRTEFSEDSLQRLAQSIREKGQLAPIRVRWDESTGLWVIISGERRYRAAKRAGLTMIDAHFHDGDISPADVKEQALIENLLRESLQPIEEARAFQQLIELRGYSQKQLAEAIRVPESKISRALALLRLPPDVQKKVADGSVSARSAYEISRLPNNEDRRSMAGEASRGRLTNEDLARAVRQRKGKTIRKITGTKQTFLTENGWRIVATSRQKPSTYYEIETALVEVIDEVRTRIKNRIQL